MSAFSYTSGMQFGRSKRAMRAHGKTIAELHEQSERITSRMWARAVHLARQADPLTSGESLLVHNWGNAAAKAAWATFDRRSSFVHQAYKRLAKAAEHRDHIAKAWHPLWCEACQAAKTTGRGCRTVKA